MKALSFILLVCLSILIPSFAPALHAQTDAKNDRKLLTRVEPVYPPALKIRQIGGTVRLEVTISAAGKVEDVEVLGGNPILAQAAVTAVKKWKYAPADSRTTAELRFIFNPYR
ncbi:MAG: energy transducer TonB [Candidatus Acidiferrales bacterium]